MESLASIQGVLVSTAPAQDSLRYRCPKGDALIPASRLEEMKVNDFLRSLGGTGLRGDVCQFRVSRSRGRRSEQMLELTLLVLTTESEMPGSGLPAS